MNADELRAIGRQMRAVRLERDISLEEVEAAIRIRTYILDGIENGEVDPTFTTMQVRGFVRNYANYLHLDLDAMSTAYQEAITNQPRSFNPFKKQDTTPIDIPIIPLRKTTTSDTPPKPIKRVTHPRMRPVVADDDTSSARGFPVWGVLIAVFFMIGMGAMGFAASEFLFSGDDATNTSVTTAPLSIQEEVQPSPTTASDGMKPLEGSSTEVLPPTATPTVVSAQGVMPIAPDSASSEPPVDMTGADRIDIIVNATDRSWVLVQVDGVEEYQGILRPGTQLSYTAQQTILFRTANAAGVDVVVNNQSLGILGERGTEYQQTFTLDNVPAFPQASPIPAESEALPTIDPAAPEPLLPNSNLPTPIPAPPILATNIPLDISPAQLTATAQYEQFEADFTPTPLP